MCTALSQQGSPTATCGIIHMTKSLQDQAQNPLHFWDTALDHVDIFIKTYSDYLCVYKMRYRLL